MLKYYRKWFRVFFPHTITNPETTETTFELSNEETGLNFNVHIWKPNRLVGKKLAGVIMFHGGGWMFGDIPMHRTLYSNMAEQLGVVVIAPEYTLSPSDVLMASYKDCIITTEYVLSNSDKLGIKRDNIVLSGDSAGGQLTIAVGMYLGDNNIDIKGRLQTRPD